MILCPIAIWRSRAFGAVVLYILYILTTVPLGDGHPDTYGTRLVGLSMLDQHPDKWFRRVGVGLPECGLPTQRQAHACGLFLVLSIAGEYTQSTSVVLRRATLTAGTNPKKVWRPLRSVTQATVAVALTNGGLLTYLGT